nr:MAG TPA: hypothetical protein [Caudoviricetes sp.]
MSKSKSLLLLIFSLFFPPFYLVLLTFYFDI